MPNKNDKLCYLILPKDTGYIRFLNVLWKNKATNESHNNMPLVVKKIEADRKIAIQKSWDVDLEREFTELAIGTTLNGGDQCPHRGLWSCSPPPLKGPQQRIIPTGAHFYNVLAIVPAQKLINRLLGHRYLAPVPTEWTLIAYLPEVKLNQLEKWDIEEEWLGLAHPDLTYPIG